MSLSNEIYQLIDITQPKERGFFHHKEIKKSDKKNLDKKIKGSLDGPKVLSKIIKSEDQSKEN